MIWTGMQLFFGFVIGALLLWACVSLWRKLRGWWQFREEFRAGFREGFEESRRTLLPSTWGFPGSYAGPKGPPELWGKRIASYPAPPPVTGRILIVDDEDATRQTVSDMLTSAGHECRSFAGGVEALALLESGEHFDLLLTDLLNLPLDGLSLLVRVRRQFPDLVVIVTGTVRDNAAIQACLRSGAYEYLVMPFDRKQLLSTVAYALATLARGAGAPRE